MNSDRDTLAGGLPHSEIPGSPIARISPGLFAACHVLHRLSVPRHPPDALLMLLAPHPTANIVRPGVAPSNAADRTMPRAAPGPHHQALRRLPGQPPVGSVKRRFTGCSNPLHSEDTS